MEEAKSQQDSSKKKQILAEAKERMWLCVNASERIL